MDSPDYQVPRAKASDWSRQVAEIVSPYDPLDLLTSVAALQLLPENADRALRLEALANIVVTLSATDSKPAITADGLHRLCNESPVADLLWQEDPSGQAFTQALTFIGGSFIVFPGIVDDSVFALQHLVWATTQHEEDWPDAFLEAVVRTLGPRLTLSDLVATRAGLSRGIPPDSKESGVYIPAPAELSRLKRAVQVSYEDLERAASLRGLSVGGLHSLGVAPGETPPERCTPTSGPLAARPVVEVNGSVVFAAPGALLPAMRHRLICLAREHGVEDMLAERYGAAVWSTARGALGFLGHEHSHMPLPAAPPEMPAIDGVFRMDTDKVLYVSLTTDDLRGYDESQVHGGWECPDLAAQLEGRQRAVEDFLVHTSRGLNEIVVLHLIQGLGRGYSLGLGPPPAALESPRLVMTASELEVIACVESGNPLLLREYARASHKVRQHTRVFSFSAIDEFAFYRSSQYSYYVHDAARPNAITVPPGCGSGLRLQAVDEIDCHAVPCFEPRYYIEVIRTEPKYRIPIYTPVDLLRTKSQIALVVEGLPVRVWVVGPDYDEEPEQAELSRIHMQVADLIAYWIWQLSPSLAPLLEPLREGGAQTIVFELQTRPGQPWLERDESIQLDSQPIAEYELLGDTIALRVNPTLVRALETRDNRGERSLMALVLRAMEQYVAGFEGEVQTTSWDTHTILDEHAPLGLKKKALVLDLDKIPALSTGGLPRHRRVQMATKTRLLDEVGGHLAGEVGLSVGPVCKEDRTGILNETVAFFYQRLCGLVLSLRPEFLPEWLIRYYEAIRYDMSHFGLTLPTRLACFGDSNDFTTKVTSELQELREAAQTARFIIEFVSAQPPQGLRPMSISVYDELQALGSEIISWAGISDLIYYDIADIDLWMLPSGRLGSNYQALISQPSQGFLHLHASEQIDRATDAFGEHWLPAADSSKRPLDEVHQIDAAFQAEYGYTLTELTTVMADCFAVGTTQESAVKKSPANELSERLSRSTGYPRAKVDQILEDLSLKSRADFLDPPAPFEKEDVYPWRFGRPLSYMRRPLIHTTQDEEPIYMWGNLHLHDSISYIVDMCLSGQLQARATSQELRSLLARFNQQRGSAFTDRVFKVFDGYGSLVADSNLKKIGKERIAKDGDDLGDIDVLVINPRRRKVLVAECKDLSIARIPYEMANELETLFEGKDGPATVDRHQRRTEWIEANLRLVLEHYGVEIEGSWEVQPVLFIDEEMLTPHIYESPMPVISFRMLVSQFVEEWV